MSGERGAVRTVPLEPGLEVIADLHLDPADARACARFAEWLDARAGLRRLVILGDLFDAWVGPGHARMEGAQVVLKALRGVVERGGEVDLLWGNRDFLLDEWVARQAGARLAGDSLIALAGDGARALFVHGDELCTLDTSYQRLRRVLRSPWVSGALLRLPRGFTLWLARRLRRGSERAVGEKAPEEMAMQVEVVTELARAHGAQILVCGHAHRWRDERLEGGLRWVVLDAFGGERDCLRVDGDGQLVGSSSGFDAEVVA